jgi:hypothetical protein
MYAMSAPVASPDVPATFAAATDPHAVPVDPRLTLTAVRKNFRAYACEPTAAPQAFLRCAAAQTAAGRTGFSLHLTNHETVVRSYQLAIALLLDPAVKTSKAVMPRHAAQLQPQQTVALEIELEDARDFARATLVEVIVYDADYVPVAHYFPDYPLALAAEPQGPNRRTATSRWFEAFVLSEWLCIAMAVSTVHYVHYASGALLSWFWGVGIFLTGAFVTRQPTLRPLVCGVLTILWGGYAYQLGGMVLALPVLVAFWLAHMWLQRRQVPRAAVG